MAQGFIDNYYGRYKELKQFQDDLLEYCTNNLAPSPEVMKNGYPAQQAQWQSVTGRIYTFVTQPTPDWLQRKGVYGSISPTQVANFPMQGFATGDIVPEILGRIVNALLRSPALRSLCLPINTVHDSIIFDVHKSVLYEAGSLIKAVMQAAPWYMEERFGVVINLPLNVDIEYGSTWEHLTKLHV